MEKIIINAYFLYHFSLKKIDNVALSKPEPSKSILKSKSLSKSDKIPEDYDMKSSGDEESYDFQIEQQNRPNNSGNDTR